MKFITDYSARCECCGDAVRVKAITVNPHHIYPIGQFYSCRCGTSSIWTNSIRSEVNLLMFIAGVRHRYHNGFCNDKFCGAHLGNNLYLLKNNYREILVTPNREIVLPPQEEQKDFVLDPSVEVLFLRTEDLLGCRLPRCCNRHMLYRPTLNDPEEVATDVKQVEWYREHLADWVGLIDPHRPVPALETQLAHLPPPALAEIKRFLKSKGVRVPWI